QFLPPSLSGVVRRHRHVSSARGGITEWQGDTDMTTLVLDMGSAMEQFDMGDAFVGAWDIANLVSDFLMEKMGAETSGCSAK
ncbi:unnamed protein product, partial [Ectocarpus sp. 13 AM-2016]